jgi:hypothetical protein
MSIKTTLGAKAADLVQQTKTELKEFSEAIVEKAEKVKELAQEKLHSTDEVTQQPTVAYVEHEATAEDKEKVSLLGRMITLIRDPELLRGRDEYLAICRKVARFEKLDFLDPLKVTFREFDQKFAHLKLPLAHKKTPAPVSPVRVSPDDSGSDDDWVFVNKK